MTRKEKQLEKALDNEISRVYAQSCSGIQIDIFDISKVFAVAKKAHSEGLDMRAAIVSFVETIRKN